MAKKKAFGIIFPMNRGYDPRFGLIYVDYRTQQRTLKDSVRWYGQVIRTYGESLHETEHNE